jgi:hypothetical protein
VPGRPLEDRIARSRLASVTLPFYSVGDMALSPAEKQQRYRDRLKAATQTSSEAVESALLAEVERAERGELSEEARIALADKLADLANRYLWHAHKLSKIAMKLRPPS